MSHGKLWPPKEVRVGGGVATAGRLVPLAGSESIGARPSLLLIGLTVWASIVDRAVPPFQG